MTPCEHYKEPSTPTWDYAPVEPLSPSPHPYCCPVCGGTGRVHWGFYDGHSPLPDSANGLTGTNIVLEQCRSCVGGVIWR